MSYLKQSSYFSPDEWNRVFDAFPGDTELGYQHVSHGQLSLARMYGGMTINGRSYTYFPATDELFREDVLKFVVKLRKESAKASKQVNARKQPSLI